MNWRRTGKKEYPEEDQNCLIYFKEIGGFCISKFNWENYEDDDGNPDLSLGKIAVFHDKGGWLGDEDLLWIPLKELEVPEDYKNDKKWKKWDDPEKVYRYVELKNDMNYRRNPENIRGYNHFDLDIPKGAMLGITSSKPWKNDGILGSGEFVHQCVYDDGAEKWLIYIAPEDVKEIE